ECHGVVVPQSNHGRVLTDIAIGIGVGEVEDSLVGNGLALDELCRRDPGDRVVGRVGDVEVARVVEGQTSKCTGGGGIEVDEVGDGFGRRDGGNFAGAAVVDVEDAAWPEDHVGWSVDEPAAGGVINKVCDASTPRRHLINGAVIFAVDEQ